MSCITITVHSLIAGIFWTIGLGLGVLDVVARVDVTALAICFMVIGATLVVKERVDRYAANWTQAYEVGREAGAGKVRRLP